MRQVTVHEAQTHLARLLDDVARGDEIVIAKAGQPVARLAAVAPAQVPRRPGLLKGKVVIGDDFDAPLPEEVFTDFEGGA